MPRSRAAASEEAHVPGVLERFLAAAATLFVGLALVGFALTLVQIGLRDQVPWLSEGIWPYAFAVPALMLPLGFVCIIALLVVSAVRKGRGRG